MKKKDIKIKLDPLKQYIVTGIGENPVLENKKEYMMNGSNAQKVIDSGEAKLVKEVLSMAPKQIKIERIK